MTSSLTILDDTGDTRIEWNSNNREEVELARKAFDAAKEKRYLAYRTRADGSKGEVLREFDSAAERIVMSPQLVGG
jgi:hypothetical protein